MPITEQGIKAQKTFDKQVDSIKKEIVSSIRNGRQFDVKELVESYHHKLHPQVREAYWQLVNDDVLKLAISEKITLT